MAILPIKDIGELDRRIFILKEYEEVDSYGQMVRAYGTEELVNNFEARAESDGATFEGEQCVVDAIDGLPNTLNHLWAKVDYVSGNEGEESNRLEAVKRVEFVIRYNSQISEKQRISWDGDVFEVEAVLPVERKRFMHLITRLVD